jgi:hypothetical protein
MLLRRYWIHSGQQQQRMLYHTLSAAVEASKFIAIACIRNPQRLHRFCRHRAHPHSLSLLFSLPPSVQTLTLPRSFGTSKAPDRNPPPGAYRDLESSRQEPPGAYRDLESSRQKLPGVYRDLDQFTTSKEVHLHVFPPLLFVSGPRNRFSLALTIILHPYTQAYSMCLLFIYCINIITHIYIQIGIFIF